MEFRLETDVNLYFALLCYRSRTPDLVGKYMKRKTGIRGRGRPPKNRISVKVEGKNHVHILL